MTRPDSPNILAITFLYYRDLPRAEAFYRDVMGFPLAIDQGCLAKIMKICDGAHVGLVDESPMACTNGPKRAPFSSACGWRTSTPGTPTPRRRGVANLSRLFVNDTIGIRAFVFEDPEGYQIEIQQATKPDA